MLNKEAIYAAACKRFADWYGEPMQRNGACLYWAQIAAGVLNGLGLRAIIQAGDMHWPIVPDGQDDGMSATHFAYVWDPKSPASIASCNAGHLPEMHCWAGIPATGELIDFSTKYLPERAAVHGMKWCTPLPPDFLWATSAKMPPGVIYRPNKQATRFAVGLLIRATRAYSNNL